MRKLTTRELAEMYDIDILGSAAEEDAEEEEEEASEEITDNPAATDVAEPAGILYKMPATLAQQIFSVVPGVAGGIAGFVLASKLANTRRVFTKGVLLAAFANAALTLLTIGLIKSADEEEEE